LDTIIYAACRLEIDELHAFRNNIKIKYGDGYILDASSNKSQLVNINVVEKLRMKVPQEKVIITRLKQLCKEFAIDYIFPEEIQPMTNMTPAFFGGDQGQFNPNFNMVGYENNYPTKTSIDESPYNNLNFTQNNQQFNNNTPGGNINYQNIQFNPYSNQNQQNFQQQQDFQNNQGFNPNKNPYPNDSQQNFNQNNSGQSLNKDNSYFQLINQSQLNQSINPNINQNLFQTPNQQGNSKNNTPSPNLKLSQMPNTNSNTITPNKMSDFPEVDGFPQTPKT